MTCRAENGAIYLQTYNAENRLDGITLLPTPGEGQTYDCSTVVTPAKTWAFTYDGDGRDLCTPETFFVERGTKVKQVVTDATSTLTTYFYAGGSYEIETDGTTETVKQYYSIAGMTIAMHTGEDWSFFLTDHLGSVVGVTDSTGTLIAETRYLPFGEVRTDIGIISQTDFGYTFQRVIVGSGLQDYKARSYDPWLGKFTQPDSIVPKAGNPQAYNRYAYASNNPINANDPTGHKPCIENDKNGNCVVDKDWRNKNNSVVVPSTNTSIPINYYYTIHQNTSSSYFRPSALPINYDKESYDDSGNDNLNNRVGIINISKANGINAAVLGISAFGALTMSRNGIPFTKKLIGAKPEVFTTIYYQEAATGITRRDYSYANVLVIGLKNSFGTDINYASVDWQVYDNNNMEISSGQTVFYSGIPGGQEELILISPGFGAIPRGYSLSVNATYVWDNFIAQTNQKLEP